jgi:hypothetical protein
MRVSRFAGHARNSPIGHDKKEVRSSLMLAHCTIYRMLRNATRPVWVCSPM